MLTYRLLHPEILEALAAAGHGSRVLIADGNYALATNTSDRARRVFLNLAPDLVRVTDVLGVLAEAMGWVPFYAMTVFASLPAMLIMVRLLRRFPELGGRGSTETTA